MTVAFLELNVAGQSEHLTLLSAVGARQLKSTPSRADSAFSIPRRLGHAIFTLLVELTSAEVVTFRNMRGWAKSDCSGNECCNPTRRSASSLGADSAGTCTAMNSRLLFFPCRLEATTRVGPSDSAKAHFLFFFLTGGNFRSQAVIGRSSHG